MLRLLTMPTCPVCTDTTRSDVAVYAYRGNEFGTILCSAVKGIRRGNLGYQQVVFGNKLGVEVSGNRFYGYLGTASESLPFLCCLGEAT